MLKYDVMAGVMSEEGKGQVFFDGGYEYFVECVAGGEFYEEWELTGRHVREEAETEKARICGCEMLYLDPGWEVAEGTTLWDEQRLGTVDELAAELKEGYGLVLGFRTVLRCYADYWPQGYLVKHEPGDEPGSVYMNELRMWELCLCDTEFWQEKLRRIAKIAEAGVKFLMVDEMDWRGPCYDERHGHRVPTRAIDHVRAVYKLCRAIRRRCPEVVIEAHDPVWPWCDSVYVPVYFGQGFGETGCYQENWGFEYMWDCLNDLRSGKALALYYYNLGCSIPLYLHITMAADNDRCLFFWWAASTVRHLGIGGKYGHPTITPKGAAKFDSEERFRRYQEQVDIYQAVKAYFVRGRFHGIAEHIHLHTLDGRTGGVVVVFNLGDEVKDYRFRIGMHMVNAAKELDVAGAEAEFSDGVIDFTLRNVEGMSPRLIFLGEAIVKGGT